MLYPYQKSPINADQLSAQIRASAITVALDYISTEGNTVNIYFKANLSTSEETILTGIVTAHTPVTVNNVSTVSVESIPAVASKVFGLKKLFRRVIGIRAMANPPVNNEMVETVLEWTVPYGWIKFLGVEFHGGEVGDYADFTVHDTNSNNGQYFNLGVKYQLNQFGFLANIGKDLYIQKAEFDADLYLGMIIKIKYYSMTQKQIGVNFIMNELKD